MRKNHQTLLVMGICLLSLGQAGCATCKKFVRYEGTKLAVSGVKVPTGPGKIVEVGSFTVDPQDRPTTTEIERLDYKQYEICNTLQNMPAGPRKTTLQEERVRALLRMDEIGTKASADTHRTLYGQVNDNGNKVTGEGWSVVPVDTAKYRVTFDPEAAFAEQPIVVATPVAAGKYGDDDNIVRVAEVSPQGFVVYTTDGDGPPEKNGFTFSVIGRGHNPDRAQARVEKQDPAYSRGTVNTAIDVDAAPFARQARIRALASADTLTDGGCMELVVTGLPKECRSGRLYRTAATGNRLEAEIRCTRSIPAGSPAVIAASAPNGRDLACPGVDGNRVELWVELQRE